MSRYRKQAFSTASFCVLGLLFLSSHCFAQEFWTLQLAAFQDYRDATQAVNALVAQGFDSYSEFFMQEDKQWVRVRLGCFDSKSSAEQFASTRHIQDAAILLMTVGAPVSHCISRNVGAVLPDNAETWGIVQSNQKGITFWLRLQNVTAYLTFDGSSWELSEVAANLEEGSLEQGPDYFREDAGSINLYYPARKVLPLTSGKLLWQHELSVVILENMSLASYRLSLNGN